MDIINRDDDDDDGDDLSDDSQAYDESGNDGDNDGNVNGGDNDDGGDADRDGDDDNDEADIGDNGDRGGDNDGHDDGDNDDDYDDKDDDSGGDDQHTVIVRRSTVYTLRYWCFFATYVSVERRIPNLMAMGSRPGLAITLSVALMSPPPFQVEKLFVMTRSVLGMNPSQTITITDRHYTCTCIKYGLKRHENQSSFDAFQTRNFELFSKKFFFGLSVPVSGEFRKLCRLPCWGNGIAVITSCPRQPQLQI